MPDEVKLQIKAEGGPEAQAQLKGTATAAEQIGPAAEQGAEKGGGALLRLTTIAVTLGTIVGQILTKFVQWGRQLSGRFVEEVGEAEAAQARLEQVIRSTGGAAGVTAEAANKLAAEMAKLTGVDDDQVVAAEAVLLTVRSMSAEVFPAATKAALDLARAMKTDAEGGAKALARALADPEGGLRALKDAQVNFTDAQRDGIKKMVESGDQAGALRVVLAEVERSAGGAAVAFRDTLPGAMEASENAAGDLFEKIGEGGLSGALKRLANEATAAAQGQQSNAEKLGKFLGTFVDLTVLAAKSFGVFVSAMQTGFGSMLEGAAKATGGMIKLFQIIADTVPGGSSLADSLDGVRQKAEELGTSGERLAREGLAETKAGFSDLVTSAALVAIGLGKTKTATEGLAAAAPKLTGPTLEQKDAFDKLKISLDEVYAAQVKYKEQAAVIAAGGASDEEKQRLLGKAFDELKTSISAANEKAKELALQGLQKIADGADGAIVKVDELGASLDRVANKSTLADEAEKELTETRKKATDLAERQAQIEARLAEMRDNPMGGAQDLAEESALTEELTNVRRDLAEQTRENNAEEANLAALRKRAKDEAEQRRLAEEALAESQARSAIATADNSETIGEQTEATEDAATQTVVWDKATGQMTSKLKEQATATDEAAAATEKLAEKEKTQAEKNAELIKQMEQIVELQKAMAKGWGDVATAIGGAHERLRAFNADLAKAA